MIKEAIAKVVTGASLTEAEAEGVMREIMQGEATDAQIAAYITALRMKGETVEEITGSARVMREKAVHIKLDAPFQVDTCGTGGDLSHTFNISTTVAFVVAGAGVAVAKHGNRSVSSKSGSADVLQALGINIEMPAQRIEECLNEVGIAFLFAPMMHQAMKYAIGPRREIGIRTIFNLLGPLTNPAGVKAQIMGVYSANLTGLLAKALGNLGLTRAYVVHGMDGLDEITVADRTKVSEYKDGTVTDYFIHPSDFDLPMGKPEDLKGGDARDNAAITLQVLKGQLGPRRDIVLVNAAAGLTAAGKAKDFRDGILLAGEAIDSGAALQKLEELKKFTNRP
ncbi:MAG: anthranilate phosphoribosyltransferase [Nitrospirae bacterium]|nr:anthranilate phosphoribosyltransferase [Nitrospirota bacterium]NTW64870.1 anthranilate phosphoribosyltransferase [Nitrospirota bacterium]